MSRSPPGELGISSGDVIVFARGVVSSVQTTRLATALKNIGFTQTLFNSFLSTTQPRIASTMSNSRRNREGVYNEPYNPQNPQHPYSRNSQTRQNSNPENRSADEQINQMIRDLGELWSDSIREVEMRAHRLPPPNRYTYSPRRNLVSLCS